MKNFFYKQQILLSFLTGLMVAIIAGYIVTKDSTEHNLTSHPIGTTIGDEIHVHSDFLFYINNERIRLTADKYQADATHQPHTYLHLHDGNDEVLHRHADNASFSDFIDSLGFKLTADCLISDDGTKYCNQGNNRVLVIVNGEKKTDFMSYVFNERDKILLYYGDINNPDIQTYISRVTDNACIYSGTCPERGVPPPENCGLTCDYAPKDTQN